MNGEPRVWQARANPAGGRDLWSAAIVAIHALLFLTLAAWTWRKWPDPIVDFGRELYVPWQITRGRVLYRDIASLFGPLSPYINAFWFRLFGVSLTTLVVCNLVIFAGVLAGVYRFVRLCADRMTAAAASLSTLLLFGFAHLVEIGNYNFAAPYSHEATHGLALSLVLLLCLARGVATREPTSWAIGGVCLGLVMLTKPETAVAAVVAVAAAIWARRCSTLAIDGGSRGTRPCSSRAPRSRQSCSSSTFSDGWHRPTRCAAQPARGCLSCGRTSGRAPSTCTAWGSIIRSRTRSAWRSRSWRSSSSSPSPLWSHGSGRQVERRCFSAFSRWRWCWWRSDSARRVSSSTRCLSPR